MANSQRKPPEILLHGWNHFEEELVEFVKKHPILYRTEIWSNNRLYSSMTGADHKRDRLWKTFAAKWNYSVGSCKSRWIMTKVNYLKTKQKNNQRSTTYKKYMDGRLSFLDPQINKLILEKKIEDITTKNAKKCVRTYARSQGQRSSFDKVETFISCGMITHKDKFTEFEEQLVTYVKDHPIIYDPRVSLNIRSTLRQKNINMLWEKLSAETGVPIADCQMAWNRISMDYYRVQCSKSKIDVTKTCFLKYINPKFDFLKPLFLAIKETTINVYCTESIETELVNNSQYCWNDFQLAVIDFVKKHPIIYDTCECHDQLSRIEIRALWENFASEHNQSNIKTGIRCWHSIKNLYHKFLKRQVNEKVPNYLPLKDMRFKKISFLIEEHSVNQEVITNSNIVTADEDIDNLFIRVESDDVFLTKEDNPQPFNETKEVYSAFTGDKQTDNLSIQDESKKDVDLIGEEELIIKSEEEGNLYDSILEVKDTSFVSDANCASYNVEPQPSTSADVSYLNRNSCESISVTTTDDNMSIKVESIDIKPEICDAESMIMLDYQQLNTSAFFREIGKFVTERFPKDHRKDILHKSWSLVTNMELSMLQEDNKEIQ